MGIELRSLCNEINRYVEKKLSRKQIEKVTGSNGWIIGYIDNNSDRDVFQRDLEQEFGITRSTASRVVELMVKKGLVVRQGVPEDGRLRKLVLTDKCAPIVEMMRDDGKKVEQTLLKGFSDEEIATMFGYIERMRENIRQDNK